jgi:hypothetical protein
MIEKINADGKGKMLANGEMIAIGDDSDGIT